MQNCLIKITLILCIIFLRLPAKSQQPINNIVKLNIPGYFLLSGNLSYEKKLTAKSTAQLNFIAGKAYGNEFKTLAARADYRFFFSKKKKAPWGFYGALGMGFEKFSFYTSYTTPTATYRRDYEASGFAMANYYGYQHRFSNGIMLDVFCGAQKLFSTFRDKEGYEYLPNTPKSWVLYFVPVAGVSAGFCF